MTTHVCTAVELLTRAIREEGGVGKMEKIQGTRCGGGEEGGRRERGGSEERGVEMKWRREWRGEDGEGRKRMR